MRGILPGRPQAKLQAVTHGHLDWADNEIIVRPLPTHDVYIRRLLMYLHVIGLHLWKCTHHPQSSQPHPTNDLH